MCHLRSNVEFQTHKLLILDKGLQPALLLFSCHFSPWAVLFYSFSVSVTAHKHILHMHYQTVAVTPSSLSSCGFVQHASLPVHRTSASFNAWVLDRHRKQHTLYWHIRVPGERTPHSTVCSHLFHVQMKQTACFIHMWQCFFPNTVCNSFLFLLPTGCCWCSTKVCSCL